MSARKAEGWLDKAFRFCALVTTTAAVVWWLASPRRTEGDDRA